MYLLPKWGKYAIRTKLLEVGHEGAKTHRLVRVPETELAQWDEDHDETGELRRRNVVQSDRPVEV